MKWFRTGEREPLGVSMSGVKLGDRMLMIGGGDPRLLAGTGAKAGLSGRAVVLDESGARSSAAAAEAEREGALVESVTAPWGALPFEAGAFDVAIIRDVLPGASPSVRIACVNEACRVLRPGGRCVLMSGTARTGIGAMLGRRPAAEGYDPRGTLNAAGFLAVRLLAERDGVSFAEGVKPNR